MVDRLTPLDASFLTLEDRTTPMHVGQVLIFSHPTRFDTAGIAGRIAGRLPAHPRYRQRLRAVPAGLANPVWVDDDTFDLDYHVRRSALPAPGSMDQLTDFIARVSARPLDRAHPLWEVHVVEGLKDNRFAVLTKTHQVLIDEVDALDIAGLILDQDDDEGPGPAGPETSPTESAWQPAAAPSGRDLVGQAVWEALRRPRTIPDRVRDGAGDLRENAGRVWRVTSTLARAAWGAPETTPLGTPAGSTRRFAVVDTELEDYRQIRTDLSRFGADVNVNDIALAAITGALRSWLQSRGEHVRPTTSIRALVPVTVEDGAGLGTSVQPAFVDLPVGENTPRVRVLQVAHSMRQQTAAGRTISATHLAELGGFAAPTLHSLGARVGSALSRRLFNLAITNVPGPQHPLHCGAAELLATYPVMPLAPGQSLAIGLTSYHGRVHYGLFADRLAMPDLEQLAEMVREALRELRESTA